MVKRHRRIRNNQRVIPALEDFSLLPLGSIAYGKVVNACPKCGCNGLRASVKLEDKEGWVEFWHKGFVNDFGGLTIRQFCYTGRQG